MQSPHHHYGSTPKGLHKAGSGAGLRGSESIRRISKRKGAVWAHEQGDGTVAKVDPASLGIAGRTKVGDSLKWADIDTGGGAVWLRTTDRPTMW